MKLTKKMIAEAIKEAIEEQVDLWVVEMTEGSYGLEGYEVFLTKDRELVNALNSLKYKDDAWLRADVYPADNYYLDSHNYKEKMRLDKDMISMIDHHLSTDGMPEE